MAGSLELTPSADGYTLDGWPVNANDALELALPGRRWLPVRFKRAFSRDEPTTFAFPLVLADGRIGEDAIIHLPPTAILRWPER